MSFDCNANFGRGGPIDAGHGGDIGPETIVMLDPVRGMAAIEELDGTLRIGAGSLYEDVLERLAAHYRDVSILSGLETI